MRSRYCFYLSGLSALFIACVMGFSITARYAGRVSAQTTQAQKAVIFPIAVWLQSPGNAEKYKAIGINRYVGLWQGPTEAQLAALQKAGMPVICQQNAESLKPRWQQEVIGFTQDDEPDNAQELPGGKGYGPPISPEKVFERYDAMKAADPTRPILLNLGQGVAWDNWPGRGLRTNKPEDYAKYLAACDIASFDIYPVVHENKQVAGKLWYVAHGVDRLVRWSDGKKPVWCCIECTHIENPNIKPTPKQVRAEVWMAIIHGARGIVYFAHQFKPKFVEAALLQDAEMSQAVARINSQIQDLAPALFEPVPDSSATWEVEGADKSAIAAITRRHDDVQYVFAVGMTANRTNTTFHLDGATGEVEVVGEDRRVPIAGGHWQDSFAGYEAHLYRIAPMSQQ